MTRRAPAAAAAAVAMTLLAPSSAAAVTDNFIGLGAPETAKAGKAFTLVAVAAFDSTLYDPPSSYVAAGVWQHRGDDPCLKAVPIDRSGWKQVIRYDYYPVGDETDDLSVELKESLRRKAGTYRWCGYVYTIEYDSSGNPSYHPKARARAKTVVRD